MQKEIYLKLTIPTPPSLTKTQKAIRVFGLVLVLFSLFLIMPKQASLSFDQEETLEKEIQTKNPTEIFIEKLNLRLPVNEASVKDGAWEINTAGASHLDVSADPGVLGNIIIYDHNTLAHFGKITRLKDTDIIEITAEDGKLYRYKVYQTYVVSPKNTEVLHESSDQALTIYTCYGFLDSKRFVVKAKRA